MLQNYWERFQRDTNCKGGAKCTGSMCFGMNADACRRAIEMILSNEMQATIYPANGYRKAMNGEAKAGDLNIVVDWLGNPSAIIETTSVQYLPVNVLSDEICRCEGNCADLPEWMEKRLPAIKMEIEELGESLDEQTILCFEEFRRVYPI